MREAKINSWLCALQTLLFAAAAYVFWYAAYPAHLHFHEQFQLFQYSEHYLRETLAMPGGAMLYAARFLTQFFYHTAIGAAVMAGLLTAVQLLTAGLLKKKILYPLTFVPAVAVWLFLLDSNAMPVLALNVCLALVAACAGVRIRSNALRWSYELLAALLLFVLAGGNGLLFLWLMAAHELCCGVRDGAAARGFLLAASAIVLYFFIPVLGTYFYNYPYEQLLKGYANFRFALMEAPMRTGALVATALTVWLLRSGLCISCKPVVLNLGLFAVVATGSFFLVWNGMDADEESAFRYDYLAREERWSALVKDADSRQPATQWEQCCLNLALAKQGVLCDRMFAYPQQGRKSLLPFYHRDYMTPMIGGEPYYHMGVVNTAQRFAFEAQESIPDYQKSARCYKRLAMTNLANGRYEVAAEYLGILKKTHYYRRWAEEMSLFLYDDAKVEADPVLGWMRRARYGEDFFFNEERLDYMLVMMLAHNSQNWMVWQYLFAYLLTTKHIEIVPQYATLMEKKLPNRTLPVHVQEALLLFWLQTEGSLEGFPWRVTQTVGERFVQFVNAANHEPAEAERLLHQHFADHYGTYYLLTKEADHE